MNTKQQARALMMRHTQTVKNRQQSMLGRAASEIGMDVTDTDYWTNIKGAPLSSIATAYNRSNVSLS